MTADITAIKTILAHQSDDTDSVSVFSAAIELAKRFEARVTGVYTLQPIGMPAPVIGRGASAVYVEEMTEMSRTRAGGNEKRFREACAAARVDHAWLACDGDPTRILSEQMHYSDIALVAQLSPHILDDMVGNYPSDCLPIVGDGPVLIVPHGYRGASFGRRILVCWKPCREAGRALRDSLPLLHGAETVVLLTIGSAEDNHTSGDRVTERLKHLGIQAERLRNYQGDGEAGSVIVHQARACKADMIVMGAYGHSRLREFVFGGATLELLREGSVPILMSH